MLEPGGVLVYAVCSLQPEEGARRIEALLAGGAPVERDPITRAELKGLPVELTPAGEVRTLPCHLAGPAGSTASSSRACGAATADVAWDRHALRPIRRALLSVYDKTGLVELGAAPGRASASSWCRPAAPPAPCARPGIAVTEVAR